MNHNVRLTAQKIAQRMALIAPLEQRRSMPLGDFRLRYLQDALVSPFGDGEWQTLSAGQHWGGPDRNFVLQTSFEVPQSFDAAAPVALHLPLGDAGEFSHPEALAYIDGQPFATTDRHHQRFLLHDQHRRGKHELLLHGWTGFYGFPWATGSKEIVLHPCAIVQIDPATREFLALARTALEAAHFLNETEPAKTRLLNALDAAFLQLETTEPFGTAFYDSVPNALQTLREGVAASGAPLDVVVTAAGHAHIDVAWLWTLAQTQRKTERTFFTALRLMEEFPQYHFTQSQPQLYQYFKQDHPEVFKDIQTRVREGRWEPIGGMWVEADCNISGGESLVRQLLLGRQFFKNEFGADAESPVLWLPDVFGYAWNLPQLIKQAGLEYFFTIKIGWNQTNTLPVDSFWWQGLDGTRVLTHFSTAPESPWHGQQPDLRNQATYNANLSAFTALGSWVNLRHKQAQRHILMSYGYGDGGGGPTREMLENANVLANFPALPQVRTGKVKDFFKDLERESGPHLPVWNSELYLEIHRGTYTSQARNKRFNRKSEVLLHDAEFLAAQASVLDANHQYPQAQLQEAWELLCLNQFHDIIPGSSIAAVYEESARQYGYLQNIGNSIKDQALSTIARHVAGDLILANTTAFSRSDLAFVAQTLEGLDGAAVQGVEGGTLVAATLAPYSARGFSLAAATPTQNTLQATPTRLENTVLRVELNDAGDITRILDKRCKRELLQPGQIANQLQLFEDRPLNWDAWDIDVFYDDKVRHAQPASRVRVLETGPLRATLEIVRQINHSQIVQRLSLCKDSARLDFDNTVSWQERHMLLKTAFPTNLLSPKATHEIQWGSVERPTHRNTSWDWARFETCAQKWVALSEHDYGVALLNDCKYGHDIQDDTIRLSLLRAPTYPDPNADQGEHQFAYSLWLHQGASNAEISSEAYALNHPIVVATGTQRGTAPALEPLVQTTGLPVIVETIKRAEDGNGLIVRLFEPNRARGEVTLQVSFALQHAARTNLLEEKTDDLPVHGNSVRLQVKPFEIVTLRLA